MPIHDKTHLFDRLKPPFRGHAICDLLVERGGHYEFVGSFSVETEEEYQSQMFIDTSVPEELSDIDPWTGIPGNQRSYDQVSSFVPTWAEIEARHIENLAEYDSYAGKRQRDYPDWRDQLDLLYHDIDAGRLGESAKTSDFYTTLKTIKDNNQ